MDHARLQRASSVNSATSRHSDGGAEAVRSRSASVSGVVIHENNNNNNDESIVEEEDDGSINWDGEAMVEAARNGNITEVNRYLLNGVSVDYEERKGAYTALIKASRMQRVDVAKLLLVNRADPNKASRNGWTALIEACRTGHEELSTYLLDIPTVRKDQKNAMGWTALVEACRNNHLHIVRLLCSRGANPYSVDEDGLIPLQHTSNTAIHDVLRSAYQQILDSPDPHPAKSYVPADLTTNEDRLVQAASDGDLVLVKQLLGEGVPIDCGSSNGGYTPLIMACRMGRLDTARHLLEQGAEINKQSKTGWTAMIEACRVGDMRVMKLLHGWERERVDMEKTQAFGWPPIIEACRNAHYDVVEQLVEWGVNVKHVDGDGDMPIDHATHPWIIGLLQDQVKFGRMGPLTKMKQGYESSRTMDSGAKMTLLLNIVHGIDADLRSSSVEDQNSAKWSMLSVVIQEFDAEFLENLLLEPGYVKLINSRAFDFMQTVLSVALPDEGDEMRNDVGAFSDCVTDMISAVLSACTNNNMSKQKAFVNAKNEEGINAVLICAEKIGQFAYPVTKNLCVNDTEFSWELLYFWNFLQFLCDEDVGGDVNSTSQKRETVLLEVMRPIGAYKNSSDFISAYIHEIDMWWTAAVGRLRAHTVKMKDDQNSALGYLVLANATDFRTDMIIEMMAAGATMPSANLSQQRLLTIIESRMQGPNNEDKCWEVSRIVVRNRDLAMLKKLLDLGLPVFMTNPAHEMGVSNTLRLPRFNPDRDDSGQQYCLLHMAVERLDEPMFNLLFEYASGPKKVYTRRDGKEITYPWPDYDYVVEQESTQSRQKVNLCVVWRNPYGRNVFHVIAKKRTTSSSNVLVSMFSKAVQHDLTAVVTRPDRYGWTPLHYGSYHNKLGVIQVLITNHVDLSQTTFDYGRHNENRTALHIASARGNWSVVLSLLEAGTAVETIDKHGCTPLALAMIARQELDDMSGSSRMMNSLSTQTMSPSELQALNRLIPGFLKRGGNMVARGITRIGTNMNTGIKTVAHGVGSAARKLWSKTGARMSHVMRASLSSARQSLMGAEEQAGDVDGDGDGDADGAPLMDDGTNADPRRRHTTDPDGAIEMVELMERRDIFAKLNARGSDDDDALGYESDSSFDSLLDSGDERFRRQREGNVAQVNPRARERRKQTYNLTIQALLSHHASIAAAAEQSGRDLVDLVDVRGRWFNLCHSVYMMEQEKEDCIDDYYMFVKEHSSPEELNARVQKKIDMERDTKVLDSRRDELFTDRETQMVIRERFNEKISARNFMKLVRYFIFLACLTLLGIAQGTQDKSSAFWMVETVRSKLTTRVFDYELSKIPKRFDEIDDDKGEYYMFLKGPFADALYQNTSTITSYWSGTTLNHLSGVMGDQLYMLGRPRLRQVRGKYREGSDCTSANKLLSVSTECFNEPVGKDSESRTQFGPASQNWVYTPDDETGAIQIWGRAGTYTGGGFVQEFKHPSESGAAQHLRELVTTLEDNNWIDAATRAVFLEMNLYNGNQNHFMVVSLLLEFPIGGGIVPSSWLLVSRLNRSMTTTDDWIFAVEIFVLVQMVLMFHSEVVQFVSNPGAYVKSVFNWVDMTLIVAVPVILGLRIAEYSEDIDWASTTTYLHTQHLAELQYTQNIVYSVIIFLAWFKLFDFLSVFEELYRMIIMIELMIGRLSNWLVVYSMIVAGFTTAELVAFGYEDVWSYTWLRGFTARFVGVFAGDFITVEHSEKHRILGTIFDLCFVVVTGMLLVNLIIALLTSAYEDALNYSADEMARRQYEQLEDAGFTKIKRLSLVDDEEASKNCVEVGDKALLNGWHSFREFVSDVKDRGVSYLHRRSTPRTRANTYTASLLRTTIRHEGRMESKSKQSQKRSDE